MDYAIKHVTTERELNDALALDKKVFGSPSERGSPAYSRGKWLERMGTHSDLMLYAQLNGEVIGIAFGRIENGRSVTVGPVAVDERFRKHGIARELMLLLEKRALGRGIHHLGLGAVESAEGFYQKLGYTGTLLIQSEKHSVEELLSLNTKYRVINTNVHEGTLNQVYLDLPAPDRELQRKYEHALPGCYTQMVFGKTIRTEDFGMRNDIGNYALHAKIWDWGGCDDTPEHEHWLAYAKEYGKNVLIPMCALGETGAYLARRGLAVTAFDVTPEMISEGEKRFGGVSKLDLRIADIRDFAFDIPPCDFAFVKDLGHLHAMADVKAAFSRIRAHLRAGGALVLEQPLPPKTSSHHPLETFTPKKQVYPGLKVWKEGETRHDAREKRTCISQTVYIAHEGGETESFDHLFYLQWFEREELISALNDCGFEVAHEYRNREREPWRAGDGLWVVEAVKKGGGGGIYDMKGRII